MATAAGAQICQNIDVSRLLRLSLAQLRPILTLTALVVVEIPGPDKSAKDGRNVVPRRRFASPETQYLAPEISSGPVGRPRIELETAVLARPVKWLAETASRGGDLWPAIRRPLVSGRDGRRRRQRTSTALIGRLSARPGLARLGSAKQHLSKRVRLRTRKEDFWGPRRRAV